MSRLYDILLLINNNEKVTQRMLADESGISLGAVNSIVKNLEEENYIVKAPNSKSDYSLTKQGMKVLENFIVENQNRRINLESKIDQDALTQAVILADRAIGDFGKPTGFLKIGEETVVRRILKLLESLDLEEVIVVAGYKSDYYRELALSNPKIRLVENDKHKYRGSMYSLSLCKDYIRGNFILMSDNLIFEERAIKSLLSSPDQTTMLITSESGSGNETLVELRDGWVYKLSKDIHQFNRVDGELVGLAKLSSSFYYKMLDQYKRNKNPYMDYEHTIIDVGREYKVGYIKLDDLMWYEINNKENFAKAKGQVYSGILRRDDKMKLADIKDELIQVLGVNEDKIGKIEPAGGMTNKNYKVDIDGQAYILRVAGAGTKSMISRINEKSNSIIAGILGLNTEILYFNEETGTKVSKLIESAETLNPTTAKKEENMEIVAHLLKKLHFSCVDFDNEFNVFREIEKYEGLVEEVKGSYYDDEYPIIRKKVMALEAVLDEIGKDLYTCHNDTVPENFIKGLDKNYLIDWEYSGMNDPMWDIAGHIIECDFNRDEEDLFKNKYFSIDYDLKKGSDKPSPVQEEKILLFKICQDFLWSIWTVYKEAKGVSFGDYGPMRYERAKQNIEKFYEIYMQS